MDWRLGERVKRSSQVNREASVWAPEDYRAVPAPGRNGPERSAPLLAQMERILGADSEPDPAFFVESWTVGVAAAAANLQQRRQDRKSREQREPAWHALDAYLPFLSPAENESLAENEEQTELRTWSTAVSSGGPLPSGEGIAAAAQDASAQTGPGTEKLSGETFGRENESGQETIPPRTLERACRLLGVAATSSQEEIKAAYRHLAVRYHPDRQERKNEQERRAATERMAAINEAYRLLCGFRLRKSA
jgi:DnaJ-domain-containing protein 1